MAEEKKRPEYAPPASMEEAQRRKGDLIAEIQKIDLQLSSKGHAEGGSFKMPAQEFYAWRHKAIFAKTKMTEELRLVKAWIRENFQLAKGELDVDVMRTLVEEAVKHGDDLVEIQGFLAGVAERRCPVFAVPDLWQLRMAKVSSDRK